MSVPSVQRCEKGLPRLKRNSQSIGGHKDDMRPQFRSLHSTPGDCAWAPQIGVLLDLVQESVGGDSMLQQVSISVGEEVVRGLESMK